ncbi:hypothetical protein HKD37_19G052611 [Glycine soja]|nr:hypothetical protein GmHk_19G053824 [Glycine max]KHN45499.1 hypothetical protein glysoja_021574 [Glycine soja]
MAVANKLLSVLIIALIAISMLQTVVMASHGHGGHHYNDKNAHHNAQGGVARPSTTSPACFSVRSVVGSAYVCHRGIMGTKQCALATTTGRPRKEDPNALNNLMLCSSSN